MSTQGHTYLVQIDINGEEKFQHHPSAWLADQAFERAKAAGAFSVAIFAVFNDERDPVRVRYFEANSRESPRAGGWSWDTVSADEA
jgi:hypothetical protein